MRQETDIQTGKITEHEDAPVPTRAQSELDAEFNAKIDAELIALDLASIRSIREYVAAQPDAPQFVLDQEAAAVTKRATRKA